VQYIILDDQKRATHKFKDGVGAKTWDEVKDFDNIGMIVPAPFIVLDFDTKSDAAIMLKIIEALDLKCRIMQTTRGIHVWFRSVEPWKNFKKTRLAIGIYSDCRSHSKNAYVKIKDGGKMREWIRDIPAEEIQGVPRWLYPVSNPGHKFEFKGMTDGDGRNQELFNYIVYLQKKGFNRDEIKEAIEVINEYVFEDPLPAYEIATICRDEAFKPDEEIAEQTKKTVAFKHNEFGDELIAAYHIITVNGQLYVYENGYYQQDERIIERKMIELFPAIKQTQRSEVLAYIRIKTHVKSEDIKVNPYIINLINTRYDIRSGQCLEFSPDVIEFDRIPVVYDPSAYCSDLDKMLNRVFVGDREVINLFEEMVGYCLIKSSRYQRAFILVGSGSNGKSTILDLIEEFLGPRNYSSLPLEKVTDRFNTAELENMLANIGDDIDNIAIKDSGTLKKMISGESITVERKGERPFKLSPYATHIYSANAIPRSLDKSEGFYRRWLFVPFNAKFSSSDPDYDPLIFDKITTEKALSYLLNVAIRGATRLIKRGRFTEPQIVKEVLERYKTENSTTLSWIDDKGLDEEYFLENSTDKLYGDFTDWCKVSGIRSNSVTGKKTFYKEIIYKFDFEDKPKQRGDGKRYFVVKID
jgi:putative DNA primase/helicase